MAGESVDENIYLATTPAYRQAGLVTVERNVFKTTTGYSRALAARIDSNTN
jgi:hypothetical protein